MLEILAAYLFLKCYVTLDGASFRMSGRTSDQCIAEFKQEVERIKASPAAGRARVYWQRSKEQIAATLTKEQLDKLLCDARARINAAKAAKK